MQDNMLPITRPDPIATRDRLRALPRSGQMLQQTIEYLTRAAQGGVPQVEPYLALSELNEIKRDSERQASSQATAGAATQPTPMTQSLPEQLKQTAGIASLQGLRQKQMMGQMMNKGAQMPQPVPEGTPQPVQAAGGGLMSLPRYRSGGVIAFQDRGAVEDPEADAKADADAEADAEADAAIVETGEVASAASTPFSADARLAQLQAQIDAQRKRKPTQVAGPADVEQELIKKYPDRYGILNTPAGADTLKRLTDFQAQQQTELGKRRGEIRPMSIGKMLVDAAEASRGQKGFGNIASMLMGAGKSAQSQEDTRKGQEQALRKEELGMGEVKMLASNKVDELRRAQASGDIQRETKARADLAKIERDYGVSLNRLLGSEYTALMGYKGRTEAANTLAAARRATAGGAKPDKEKTLERLATARTALVGMTPGTPEYARQQEVIKGLQQTVQEGRDVGPNRADIMRQSNLIREGASVQKAMQTFSTSPAYLSAVAMGDENTAKRLWDEELAKQRGLFPGDRPAAAAPADTVLQAFDGASPAAAPAARPAAQALPTGLTAANAGTLLKDGALYQTQQGPGRWNAAKGKFVAVE